MYLMTNVKYSKLKLKKTKTKTKIIERDSFSSAKQLFNNYY
jgi:hypothetical protein